MAAFLPMLLQAGATLGSGYLAGRGNKGGPTKMQKTQQKLVDQLLASLQGNGPFANLFQADEGAFQKSFLDPALSMFKNQVAPQIQQQYISSGQQRGTGLEDTLQRAGVDLDQMLNQQYYQFQQDAQNKQMNTLNSILGMGAGAQPTPSSGQNIMSSLSGYLSSPGFANESTNILDSYGFGRKGFAKPNPMAQGAQVAGG